MCLLFMGVYLRIQHKAITSHCVTLSSVSGVLILKSLFPDLGKKTNNAIYARMEMLTTEEMIRDRLLAFGAFSHRKKNPAPPFCFL